MPNTTPSSVSSQWLQQQINDLAQRIDLLLDQLVFDEHYGEAVNELIRVRLHLMHACHHCHLPPLITAPLTTEATPIAAEEIDR